ncbi:hypothetical protein [Nitrospira moscoviensis]|uniref:Outer membrane protein beta-barrel domain-containing protein n=1 Tax=Nitrospira moscoviensis TaxID=42253 RepID=A0A0K2GF62_NITMO|nr:hypothetical protein [Nitrospira moscoviensis]ALA59600.1 conserved exported protein of unknown function [Nitrospira moscoviensis]
MPVSRLLARFVPPTFRALLCLIGLLSALPAMAQEALLEILPLRPFNFDIALRQQSFAPDDREITLQAGVTALRYGDGEVRLGYQYFSIHTDDFKTDQHAVFLNPRWNNVVDLLDFPASMPINRLLRHILFGPLEDRAIPYVGALIGTVLSAQGRTSPGLLYGGQAGVRFPVGRGISLDLSLQFTQYEVNFRGESGESQQWLFLTGIRY